jgi:hypothetical protein
VSYAMDQDRFTAWEARMEGQPLDLDPPDPPDPSDAPKPIRGGEKFYDEATGGWWTRPTRIDPDDALAGLAGAPGGE